MISSATYRVIVFCEGQQVLILCFVLCACLTYKRTRLSCDDECFRNGLVHEFHSLKSLKTLKEVNTSDVEKIKNERNDHLFLLYPDKSGPNEARVKPKPQIDLGHDYTIFPGGI